MLVMPAMANPLQDSLQMSEGSNWKNIAVTPTSNNWVTNSVGQALNSLGPQTNNLNDVVAMSGSATGAAVAGASVNAPATSGNSDNADNLLDICSCNGLAGANADSSAKSEDNKAHADANGAEVESGDADNHVDQDNKVDQDAYARIKNDQKNVQIVKIKEFQIVKAESNPEVDFDNSILTENDTIMSGSEIKVD